VCEDTRSKERKVLVSAASSYGYEDAIIKTLTEMYTLMMMFKKEDIWPEPREFAKDFLEKYLTLPERCRILYKENAKRIDFMFSGRTIRLSELKKKDLKNNLEEVLQIFKKEGFHVYRYESKNPFLYEVVYKLVRVVIPEMLQYYMNEPYAMIKGSRLESFLKSNNRDIVNFKLNTFPHPFP
jgi:hypothetical protein